MMSHRLRVSGDLQSNGGDVYFNADVPTCSCSNDVHSYLSSIAKILDASAPSKRYLCSLTQAIRRMELTAASQNF